MKIQAICVVLLLCLAGWVSAQAQNKTASTASTTTTTRPAAGWRDDWAWRNGWNNDWSWDPRWDSRGWRGDWGWEQPVGWRGDWGWEQPVGWRGDWGWNAAPVSTWTDLDRNGMRDGWYRADWNGDGVIDARDGWRRLAGEYYAGGWDPLWRGEGWRPETVSVREVPAGYGYRDTDWHTANWDAPVAWDAPHGNWWGGSEVVREVPYGWSGAPVVTTRAAAPVRTTTTDTASGTQAKPAASTTAGKR